MKNKFVFLIITDDYKKVVVKGFKTMKDNPFYGIKLEDFDYKLKPNYLIFNNLKRAKNVITHYHFKELAEENNCKFKVYNMICHEY